MASGRRTRVWIGVAALVLVTACAAGPGTTSAGAGASEVKATPSGIATWTDVASGLEWQAMPTGGPMDWEAAAEHCAALGSGWRLPTIDEQRSLIRGCEATATGGSCNVQSEGCQYWGCRDESCNGCSGGDPVAGGCYWPSELGGECSWYWSSSLSTSDDGFEWLVGFDDGGVYDGDYVDGVPQVRCVR